jgi:hypothetical protein
LKDQNSTPASKITLSKNRNPFADARSQTVRSSSCYIVNPNNSIISAATIASKSPERGKRLLARVHQPCIPPGPDDLYPSNMTARMVSSIDKTSYVKNRTPRFFTGRLTRQTGWARYRGGVKAVPTGPDWFCACLGAFDSDELLVRYRIFSTIP